MADRVILRTLVGSRAFGMQRPDSDYDYYNIFVAPTEDILKGTAKTAPWDSLPNKESNENNQYHEAKTVVDQLIKGNINHYLGVLANGKLDDFGFRLQTILRNNFAKNVYHHAKGLYYSMHKKYYEYDKLEPKRVNLTCRVAKWTIGVLLDKTPDWNAPQHWTMEELKIWMQELETAYQNSPLPERPDEAPFREWLLNLRLSELPKNYIYTNGPELV